MTIVDFFERNYVPTKRIGHNTQRLFRHALSKFQRYLGRITTLDDLTDRNVSGLMCWSIHTLGLAARTANELRERLLAIWRMACRMNLLDVWPMVAPEPEPERIPVAYTVDELTRLLSAAQDRGPIWYALALTCFETGERIGALFPSEWAWLRGDALTIPASARKGRRKPARYLLRPGCVQALGGARVAGNTRLFPFRCSNNSLYHGLKKIVLAAGLEYEKTYSGFHKFRRTYASWIEAAGGNATTALGHSSRRVTESYLDPQIVGAKRWCELLPVVSGDDPKDD